MSESTSTTAVSTQRTAAALLSRSLAYEADVLPLAYDGTNLTVAVATESDDLVERIRQQTRKDVRTVLLPVRDIREGVKSLYPSAAQRDADSITMQTVDDIVASAITNYASDVHIEPAENRAGRVRLDVDGVLQSERDLEAGLFDRVIALLKVRSNMNTGESRLPQDGRLTVSFDGRSFDVRSSTVPIGGSEKMVLRFLQRFDLVPDLEQLGMGAELLSRYQRALKRPGSFCVITGPTGSGKSTTSYASLQTLDLDRLNVCSVEDPVEYTHRWLKCVVTQYEIGRDLASFGEGIRGTMRADPDILFVGELHDAETVSACLQAAETGHLVFASLHAPSNTSLAINRIIGLFGADEQERIRWRLADALHSLVGLALLPVADGAGLRVAAEVLVSTEAVRRLIREGNTHQIHAAIVAGKREGMQTLESSLSDLVAAGEIDISVARSAASHPDDVRAAPASYIRR